MCILGGFQMFLTFEHAEVPVGALVKGAHSWRYVEYISSYPYFHVTALDRDGEGERLTTLLIYTVPDLLDLAASESQGWLIQQVQLVSPGHMNGTGQWKMEELGAIEAVEFSQRTSYAYLLAGGGEYVERKEAASQPQSHRRVVYRPRSGG
ncbi:hypothetical protein D9M70_392550 [compost metagenome]